jgi:hypothetical protein
MFTLKQISFVFVLVFALLSTAAAQDSPSAQRSSLTITAAAAGERVRITAASSVVQMHVEVYAAAGEKLFDQEIRGGNVFDWHLQDGQGQRLAPGTYVCVVTAKAVSGKITQKIGTVSVEEKSVSVQPAESPQLSVQQTQVIGPVEENSSWTISENDAPLTTTVIAHDGTDGQMIRGRGALTFRIGNFFTGNDTEQMRLTEAGNLGIGTSDPRSRLDVAGTIRAERFLMAKPKSNGVDKAATANVTTDSGDFQPLIMGTGTQDRIAKWTDNSGTLGDSGITETAGGFIGIGTTAPSAKLVVSLNSATLPPAAGIARFADADGVQTTVFADSFGTNPIFNVRRANGTAAAPSALQASQLIGVIGASGYGASAYSGTRARVGFFASENWTNTANGTYLTFNTTANGTATAGGAERMRIDSTGNVGIFTLTPSARLSVVGPVANEIVGAAMSSTFRTSAGTLGVTPGDELSLASIGFHSGSGNNSSLGIRGRRITGGNSWTTTAIGLGMDVDNTVRAGDATVWLHANGNVGIGQSNPTAKLTVEGTVQSNSGGFKFPDGSVQTTAANATYTTVSDTQIQLTTNYPDESVLLHLNLPAGTYLLWATVKFRDTANYFNSDNRRGPLCRFSPEPANGDIYPYYSLIAGSGGPSIVTSTFHSLLNISSGGVDLLCRPFGWQDSLFAENRRLTAVKIEGNLSVQ